MLFFSVKQTNSHPAEKCHKHWTFQFNEMLPVALQLIKAAVNDSREHRKRIISQ